MRPSRPRWLQGRPGIDPWERGNRWVMELAETWGAGGTAHMVRLAKAMPSFELDIIDSRDLLH